MSLKELEFFKNNKEITLFKIAACKVAEVITDIKYTNNPVNKKQIKKNELLKEIRELYLPITVEVFIIKTIKIFVICDIARYRITNYNNILIKDLYKWVVLRDNIKYKKKTKNDCIKIIKQVNKLNEKKQNIYNRIKK